MTACAKDANDQIFPLAFGIGDSENGESWDYFLKQLGESYGERDGLWIVLDRHKSIHKKAAKWHPNVTLGYCNYHWTLNLKSRFPSVARALTKDFRGAWQAYTVADLDYHLTELDKILGEIRKYLEKVGMQKWAKALSPRPRYGVMTSNTAESMSSKDKNASDMPMTTLMEWLRSVVQDWFF